MLTQVFKRETLQLTVGDEVEEMFVSLKQPKIELCVCSADFPLVILLANIFWGILLKLLQTAYSSCKYANCFATQSHLFCCISDSNLYIF